MQGFNKTGTASFSIDGQPNTAFSLPTVSGNFDINTVYDPQPGQILFQSMTPNSTNMHTLNVTHELHFNANGTYFMPALSFQSLVIGNGTVAASSMHTNDTFPSSSPSLNSFAPLEASITSSATMLSATSKVTSSIPIATSGTAQVSRPSSNPSRPAIIAGSFSSILVLCSIIISTCIWRRRRNRGRRQQLVAFVHPFNPDPLTLMERLLNYPTTATSGDPKWRQRHPETPPDGRRQNIPASKLSKIMDNVQRAMRVPTLPSNTPPRLGPAIVDRQIVHIHEEDSGMRMVNDNANQGSESAMVIVLPPAYTAL